MALPIQKSREIVFQLLYSISYEEVDTEALVKAIMSQQAVAKKHVRQALERAQSILEKKDLLDEKIASFSKEYSLEQIHLTERCALRLGFFEMLYDDAIPPKVAITESVRISKKYGSASGASFVNALLDELYQKEKNERDTK